MFSAHWFGQDLAQRGGGAYICLPLHKPKAAHFWPLSAHPFPGCLIMPNESLMKYIFFSFTVDTMFSEIQFFLFLYLSWRSIWPPHHITKYIISSDVYLQYHQIQLFYFHNQYNLCEYII